MKTPDEFQSTESFLRSLSPAPAVIDRDRLMFESGRAAGKQSARAWQVSAAAFAAALAAVTLIHTDRAPDAAVIARHNQSSAAGVSPTVVSPEDATIDRPIPAVLRASSGSEALTYVELRRRVLESGLEALPRPPHRPGRTYTAQPLRPADWPRFLENTL